MLRSAPVDYQHNTVIGSHLLRYEGKKDRRRALRRSPEGGETRLAFGRRILTAIVAAALAAALAGPAPPPPASAVPAPGATAPARVPYPDVLVQPPAGLDEATRKAADMQKQVEDLQAESKAIDARIKATTNSIYRQTVVVETARAQEASAQARFDERVIGMYKTGTLTPLELILSAPTFHDALDRGIFLLTVVERDQELLADATRISSDAAYQAQLLDQLRVQQVQLREAHDDRLLALQSALGRQQQLVAQLNDQQRRYLEARAAWDAAQQQQWVNSSFYGTDVPKVPAQVLEYPGTPFLVDQGEPLVYKVTSPPRTAICSWYGNADNAPTPFSTASGRIYNENEFTCASRPGGALDYEFGTRLALTLGRNHIIVVVTDHGPYHKDASGRYDRDLDLSKAAAYALGFDGVQPVTVQTVAKAQ